MPRSDTGAQHPYRERESESQPAERDAAIRRRDEFGRRMDGPAILMNCQRIDRDCAGVQRGRRKVIGLSALCGNGLRRHRYARRTAANSDAGPTAVRTDAVLAAGPPRLAVRVTV
jgi:hypothetical protein